MGGPSTCRRINDPKDTLERETLFNRVESALGAKGRVGQRAANQSSCSSVSHTAVEGCSRNHRRQL